MAGEEAGEATAALDNRGVWGVWGVWATEVRRMICQGTVQKP